MTAILLTPTSLRSSTLSTASGKEGKKEKPGLPSLWLAIDRVIHPPVGGADRVSQLCDMLNQYK